MGVFHRFIRGAFRLGESEVDLNRFQFLVPSFSFMPRIECAFTLVVHDRLIERGDVLGKHDLSCTLESHHGVDVGRLLDHRGVIEVGGLWGHAGLLHLGCAFDKSFRAIAS